MAHSDQKLKYGLEPGELSQGFDASQTQSNPVKRKVRRRSKTKPIPDEKGGLGAG